MKFQVCLLAAGISLAPIGAITSGAEPLLQTNALCELPVTKRFLNLPVKNGAPQRHLKLLAGGETQLAFDMELADHDADWWAFIDISRWHGTNLALQVETLPIGSAALTNIHQSDQIEGSQDLYREALRPQFHFSSRRGWNNDPNGLAFFKGEYHLFYQHNPFGWNWGNMHWGHAISRDLVHWRELGDVLAPDELGPMFSGSAVVDWKNTSNLGKTGHPPLVLIYTAAGNPTVQCLASSLDGRFFQKFASNPVVKQITAGNRDPKVFWYEPAKKWVMTLYVETNHVHTVHFLTSSDLKNWSITSSIDGFFECPDFFELPVDGQQTNKKWVLTAANSDYRVGTFDGIKFTPETPSIRGNYGRGYYAAQTYSDIPARDGRRIRIGWFQAPAPGMPFNQGMTIPSELKLTTTADGHRLTWLPVKELKSLRTKSVRCSPLSLNPGSQNPLAKLNMDLIEFQAEFEPGEAQMLLSLHGAQIVYDGRKQELIVNGAKAPAPSRNGRQRLTVYCDRTMIEAFASDGLVYVPMPFIGEPHDQSLKLEAKEGSIKFDSLVVHELKSIWSK